MRVIIGGLYFQWCIVPTDNVQALIRLGGHSKLLYIISCFGLRFPTVVVLRSTGRDVCFLCMFYLCFSVYIIYINSLEGDVCPCGRCHFNHWFVLGKQGDVLSFTPLLKYPPNPQISSTANHSQLLKISAAASTPIYSLVASVRRESPAVLRSGIEGECRPRVGCRWRREGDLACAWIRKTRPPSPISLRHSAADQWRFKPISADRRVPSSGLIYHPSGGPSG